jgi:hypothetical protein
MSSQRDRQILRALGRCTGALIFAVFGACWLLLSCAYMGRFHLTAILPICLFASLLVFTALRMQRHHAVPVLDEALAKQKKREDRVFGIINAITYTAVFLLFLLLPRFGLQNYIFPCFVTLVGLHFFPMPPLYRHTANLVIGGFMVLWAVLCAVAFKASGNTMAAYVALGAGLALWSSSIWALRTAKQLFNEQTPE